MNHVIIVYLNFCDLICSWDPLCSIRLIVIRFTTLYYSTTHLWFDQNCKNFRVNVIWKPTTSIRAVMKRIVLQLVTWCVLDRHNYIIWDWLSMCYYFSWVEYVNVWMRLIVNYMVALEFYFSGLENCSPNFKRVRILCNFIMNQIM